MTYIDVLDARGSLVGALDALRTIGGGLPSVQGQDLAALAVELSELMVVARGALVATTAIVVLSPGRGCGRCPTNPPRSSVRTLSSVSSADRSSSTRSVKASRTAREPPTTTVAPLARASST